jgi:hypothetical protein
VEDDVFSLFEEGQEYLAPGLTLEVFAAYFVEALKNPDTHVIIISDPEGRAQAIAWCQVLVTGSLFIHYVYARKRYGHKLAQMVDALALKTHSRRITGVTRRDLNFVEKIFVKKYGYQIVGYWLDKETT